MEFIAQDGSLKVLSCMQKEEVIEMLQKRDRESHSYINCVVSYCECHWVRHSSRQANTKSESDVIRISLS